MQCPIFTARSIRGVLVYVCVALLTLWALYLSSAHLSNVYHWTNYPIHATTDWSHYAYVQYATNIDYLCNSAMLFERLHSFGSKAERVLLYPSTMDDSNDTSTEKFLLHKLSHSYNVKLNPISILHKDRVEATWADSFTKLLAFNLTTYKRVLHLDSDSTLTQHMDELFALPSAQVSMPRAYWLTDSPATTFSSQVLLLDPSSSEFQRIQRAIVAAGPTDFDMDILNQLYHDSCQELPYREYDLLTGELCFNDHAAYLGEDVTAWDPVAALARAKYIHFSDWPVPKPWIKADPGVMDKAQPQCGDIEHGQSCVERDLWWSLYIDFQKRRKQVCNLDLVQFDRSFLIPPS